LFFYCFCFFTKEIKPGVSQQIKNHKENPKILKAK
jgi:hypothetical protein